MYKKVRKAVIPAAGLGTRFLPATKALAKEMLPIVDIPTLDYQVDEAIKAGVEEVILIISEAKEDIKKHFSREEEYENYLISKGNHAAAEMIKHIATKAKITYVYQHQMLGLGHAILCTKEAVGDEPFIVILGDDLIINEGGDNVSEQMVKIYNETGSSVIGCQQVALENVSKYGIMALKSELKDRKALLFDMVEKPAVEAAPSRLACLGRYLLTPEIFKELENTKPGKGGEIQLTDAIKTLAQKEDVYVYDFIGRRYDVGDKYGYVEAVIDFALKRDDMKDKVLAHISDIINKERFV